MLVSKKTKKRKGIVWNADTIKEGERGGGGEGGRGQKEVDPRSLSPWSTDSFPIKTRLAMPPNVPAPSPPKWKKKKKKWIDGWMDEWMNV